VQNHILGEIARYETDINNTAAGHYWKPSAKGQPPWQNQTEQLPVFATDSNGMLMVERTANKTGWGADEGYFHITDAVAGNYFPLASPGAIRIKSTPGSGSETAFALVTDRAHGASGLERGWVEVMLGWSPFRPNSAHYLPFYPRPQPTCDNPSGAGSHAGSRKTMLLSPSVS
jgi:hypothetical protein